MGADFPKAIQLLASSLAGYAFNWVYRNHETIASSCMCTTLMACPSYQLLKWCAWIAGSRLLKLLQGIAMQFLSSSNWLAKYDFSIVHDERSGSTRVRAGKFWDSWLVAIAISRHPSNGYLDIAIAWSTHTNNCTSLWGGQLILANKLLPKLVPHEGQVLAEGGPVLAAKIGPPDPF